MLLRCNELLKDFANGCKLDDYLTKLIRNLPRIHIFHNDLLIPVAIVRLFQLPVVETLILRRRVILKYYWANGRNAWNLLKPHAANTTNGKNLADRYIGRWPVIYCRAVRISC